MTTIVLPASAAGQGHAFEDLILSHYTRSGLYKVREWSSYLHGASGQWWQCDGIVENDRGRYLVEAKFFRDRPASTRDMDPDRRQAAAQDLACTGLLYISLNGFTADMLDWPHRPGLEPHFFTWSDIRSEVISGSGNYASVLLDPFNLQPTQAQAASHNTSLYYDTLSFAPLSPRFPEFVVVPDSLELWLRRLPRLPQQLAQTSAGKFFYDITTGQVSLIAGRASNLSLQEAWAIQDSLSGYASRTYNAVRATAEAIGKLKDGLVTDIQAGLQAMGWQTGLAGVRSSLDFLVLLGLVHKQPDGRRTRYTLTPLGRAYTVNGPDDTFFVLVLKNWPPYQAVCRAVRDHRVPATPEAILTYFKAQYAPYEPYARSLFNPNKAEGLIRLYQQFGA